MRTENPQLWQRKDRLHPQRRHRNRPQNTAGYSTGIVPSDPPCPEPKVTVGDANWNKLQELRADMEAAEKAYNEARSQHTG